MAGPVRLTVNVSSELNAILEDLAKETSSTKSEVFRKAIALIDVSHQAAKDGKKVGIAKEGQDLATEFIGL